MFAIIVTGGKQYPVKQGDVITIEKLDLDKGSEYKFDNVLAISDGSSFVNEPKSATITGKVVKNLRGEKVYNFKKRRRHTYKRKIGHRQYLTQVLIESIKA